MKVRGPAEGKDPRNEGHAALIQAGLAAEEAKKGIFTEVHYIIVVSAHLSPLSTT